MKNQLCQLDGSRSAGKTNNVIDTRLTNGASVHHQCSELVTHWNNDINNNIEYIVCTRDHVTRLRSTQSACHVSVQSGLHNVMQVFLELTLIGYNAVDGRNYCEQDMTIRVSNEFLSVKYHGLSCTCYMVRLSPTSLACCITRLLPRRRNLSVS